MIVIVDSGIGNLRSVLKAVAYVGFKAKVSACPGVVRKAEKLILPGVGDFGAGMVGLRERNLLESVKKHIERDKAFLGICVGFQMLFEKSAESKKEKGLDIFPGRVRRFPRNQIVPHMGWNSVKICRNNVLARKMFQGIPDGSFFYFAHSFYVTPKRKAQILSTTRYGIDFASAIAENNCCAVQFHPEKSQSNGLRFFKNFLSL